MNDDELLRALKDTAVDEERAHDAWTATAEGRALASPNPAVLDAVVANALARLATKTQAPTAVRSPADAATREPGGAPPRVRQRVALGVAALAIAAGVALFVRSGDDRLPLYDVTIVAGAEQTGRGEPSPVGPLVFRPGGAFEVTLRPATQVAGPIAVRAQLVARDGAAPLVVDATPSANGVVHVRGAWPASSTNDPRKLVLVVGRPDALPGDPSTAAEPKNGAWRVVRIDVVAPSR